MNIKKVILEDKSILYGFEDDYITGVLETTKQYYEYQLLEYFVKYIPKEAVIYDIGGNIGNHAIYFYKYLNPAQLYTFEPDQETYEVLQKNLHINNIEDIVSFNCAIGEEESMGSIKRVEGNMGGNSVQEDINGAVVIKPIDALQLKAPGFIKIDVEGAELSVLRGMEQTLKENSPVLWVEVFSDKFQQVTSYLNSIGYEIIERIEMNCIYLPAKTREEQYKHKTEAVFNINNYYEKKIGESREKYKQSSEQVSLYKERLEQSREKYKQSSEQVSLYKERLEQSREKYKQSSEQVSLYKERLEQSREKCKQSSEQVSLYKERLEQSREKYKQNSQQVLLYKEKLEQANDKYRGASKQITEYKEQLQKNNENYKESLEVQQEKYQMLEVTYNQSINDYEQLNEKFNDTERRLRGLEEDNEALRIECKNLSEAVVHLNKEREEFYKDKQVLARKTQQYLDSIEFLVIEKENLEQKRAYLIERTETLYANNQTLVQELANLKNQHSALKNSKLGRLTVKLWKFKNKLKVILRGGKK